MGRVHIGGTRQCHWSSSYWDALAKMRCSLSEVAGLLRRALRAWNQISPDKQCELNAMHHDEGSLALCLRRAEQAADELVEGTKDA